jgi:hypothetical protein
MTRFGFDINNPGASGGSRGAIEMPSAYFDGIVEDIIINETRGEILTYNQDGSNIGEALVRILPDDWGLSKESLKPAYPLEMNIQEFPLVGERVIVFKAFGTLFYTRKLNTKRKLTENITASTSDAFGPSESNSQDTRDIRQLAIQGIPVNLSETINSTRISEFKSNPNTRPLRANEGDMILSGRFGNFIRMGSSLFVNPNDPLPQPNIILTAGTWDTPKQLSTGASVTPYSLAYENINNDKSSIWLIANQKVKFAASTALGDRENKAHLLSSENTTIDYIGAQIFINSDRVILNSKKHEISLFSNTEINLSSLNSITLDTERNAYIRAFGNVNIKADDTISLVGNTIFIGKQGDNTEPLVLGAALSVFLQQLITTISTNINAGIVVTPSGPGAVTFPTLVTALEVLSNSSLGGGIPQLAVFNSRNNFTSETNSV